MNYKDKKSISYKKILHQIFIYTKMKYIKKYENVNDKYNKGDYAIFTKNKYRFNKVIISAGKPYEIIDTVDNNFESSVIIYDDDNEKRSISFTERSMRKISTEKALMILAKEKYNI